VDLQPVCPWNWSLSTPHGIYGFRYWGEVFKPTSDAFASLGTSIVIAVITVLVCLLLAVPAGYALGRRLLPGRGLILLIILLPQAFPSVAVYLNIARLFYMVGLNGTIAGVALVHAVHGLVIAVWIAAAAFAAVDVELELAARNMGASPLRTALTVTLPLAAPGLMAAAIFVFLESLDEFTGTYFVGVPDVTTLPLMMFTASLGGNYQIAAIAALILLVPSITFMLLIERFLNTEMLAKIG
jgi:ABC-type spermidine/putrescine transport system permease subunit II